MVRGRTDQGRLLGFKCIGQAVDGDGSDLTADSSDWPTRIAQGSQL